MGLTETARELCKASSVSSLVASNRKCQHTDVTVDAAEQNSSQSKHARLPESGLIEHSQGDKDPDSDPEIPHTLRQVIDQPLNAYNASILSK
ncbi:MAG: hypothetical protein Q9226_007913 [Calogaya cf. arnoldii]